MPDAGTGTCGCGKREGGAGRPTWSRKAEVLAAGSTGRQEAAVCARPRVSVIPWRNANWKTEESRVRPAVTAGDAIQSLLGSETMFLHKCNGSWKSKLTC